MKKIFILALIFLFYNAGIAAPADTPTPREAKQIVREIMDAVDINTSIEVAPARIPNAAAVMYRNKRYILYNPSFVDVISKITGNNKWATVAILAHELGHHLYGHTDKRMSSNPDIELQADAFTGYALRKMGASLEESQLTMKIIASRRGSETHPARHDRLSSIAAGWSKADKQLGGDGYVAKTEVPQRSFPAENAPQKRVLIILVR
jgi:hypothetical protein